MLAGIGVWPLPGMRRSVFSCRGVAAEEPDSIRASWGSAPAPLVNIPQKGSKMFRALWEPKRDPNLENCPYRTLIVPFNL